MAIPTEPIGSIPRPQALLEAIVAFQAGKVAQDVLDQASSEALRDTITRLEATGSPVLTDGEQTKPSFATYPLTGIENLAADGVVIPFADGHTRQLPRLTGGPFRYGVHADSYLKAARSYTQRPVKQAVISASALSLLYPAQELPGYSREAFTADLLNEAEADIRGALDAGAATVQIDFTEGRLSLKLDPSGNLLRSFVALNNQVLDRFNADERRRIGVHVCPGGDHDSTHSADVDYAGLLPELFQLNVGKFYLQMASEPNRKHVLQRVGQLTKPEHLVFIGVIDPINSVVETADQVYDRVLEAASFLPAGQLGTTDDCGFAPFADDTSTARETAFQKIRARVEGTERAAQELGY
ncbi:cobalamin-independent methionine synthase II family protein [Granulicella arctica]|uniref:5-methyltetrahydropteroyltriglutamate--homocysteine methyltransferase n=1 Tax=Granulicella arctica TaxID=940613 RepID=A0A7Y9PJP2_9BACT|nr:cobalamin-independent methionine synthase II family protein [Granulicella arctica]NYF80298.1 5-methyltetrahydropteroyltriglutamate--homocysteine methyltransferase [Granulicella arctica]